MATSPKTPLYAQYLNALPSIPEIAAKVLFMVEGGKEISFADLEQTIGADPSLVAKLLKIANSAQFARSGTITRLSSAISILGFNTIRSLMLLVIGANLFTKEKSRPFFQSFWQEALGTAFRAQGLAREIGYSEVSEEVFTGGLLRNIGQAALYLSDPEGYGDLHSKATGGLASLSHEEQEKYGVDHKQIGAAVFQYWHFPPLFVDLAREHGNEQIVSPHKAVILLVSTAGSLTGNARRASVAAPALPPMAAHLRALDLTPEWLDSWETRFEQGLEHLPLYSECRSLFLG